MFRSQRRNIGTAADNKVTIIHEQMILSFIGSFNTVCSFVEDCSSITAIIFSTTNRGR